ncbi:MAG: ROK family transcriptional regulator [Actinomycetota bacterium]|nr:ROK family transcriptional regulator [Actinomycetota bacterium]
MSARSGSLESLRELNRLRVVEALRERGTASRAEIARHTGLSRSTVSSLVADLQAHGLVVDHRDGESLPSMPTGRPPTLLALDRSAGAALGIDFGHDRIHAAVSDLSRTILAESVREQDVDNCAVEALDLAAVMVGDLLDEVGLARGDVIGVGMALSGPIDHARGAVHETSILPGWAGLAVGAEMSRRIGGLPVHLDNDANLGALAEVTLGAGREARNALYVMISAGIGAGLIVDGRPYRGRRGMAGEIGHVLVDETGPICRCGNRGCLETYASGPALVELLRSSRGEELTVAEMVRLAREGDAGCQRAIGDAGRILGRVVAAVCNVFNPEMVVVGGDLGEAGDLLLDPMREAVDRYAIAPAAADAQVVAGELGERAQVLGALALAILQAEHLAAHIAPPATSNQGGGAR